MSKRYSSIAFTERVRDAQSHYGSRELYPCDEVRDGAGSVADALSNTERSFLADRDGFYLASVSETGWPYIQYRGGPPGFLRVLDDHTIGWADFRGNLQYISAGNIAGDDRVSLFVMDYAHRRRLKIFGRAQIIDAKDDVRLTIRLADPDYDAEVERVVVVSVQAYDWNCPQHITRRFTLAEIEALGVPSAG